MEGSFDPSPFERGLECLGEYGVPSNFVLTFDRTEQKLVWDEPSRGIARLFQRPGLDARAVMKWLQPLIERTGDTGLSSSSCRRLVKLAAHPEMNQAKDIEQLDQRIASLWRELDRRETEEQRAARVKEAAELRDALQPEIKSLQAELETFTVQNPPTLPLPWTAWLDNHVDRQSADGQVVSIATSVLPVFPLTEGNTQKVEAAELLALRTVIYRTQNRVLVPLERVGALFRAARRFQQGQFLDSLLEACPTDMLLANFFGINDKLMREKPHRIFASLLAGRFYEWREHPHLIRQATWEHIKQVCIQKDEPLNAKEEDVFEVVKIWIDGGNRPPEGELEQVLYVEHLFKEQFLEVKEHFTAEQCEAWLLWFATNKVRFWRTERSRLADVPTRAKIAAESKEANETEDLAQRKELDSMLMGFTARVVRKLDLSDEKTLEFIRRIETLIAACPLWTPPAETQPVFALLQDRLKWCEKDSRFEGLTDHYSRRLLRFQQESKIACVNGDPSLTQARETLARLKQEVSKHRALHVSAPIPSDLWQWLRLHEKTGSESLKSEQGLQYKYDPRFVKVLGETVDEKALQTACEQQKSEVVNIVRNLMYGCARVVPDHLMAPLMDLLIAQRGYAALERVSESVNPGLSSAEKAMLRLLIDPIGDNANVYLERLTKGYKELRKSIRHTMHNLCIEAFAELVTRVNRENPGQAWVLCRAVLKTTPDKASVLAPLIDWHDIGLEGFLREVGLEGTYKDALSAEQRVAILEGFSQP